MIRLRHRDLAAFSEALTVLYAEDSYETLSSRVLACLHRLFEGEFVSFSAMDLRKGKLLTTSFLPAIVPNWPGMAVYQQFLSRDPCAAHIMRTKSVEAVKMSDFVSLREYRDLPVYTEVFGKVGCNRRLGFAVQNAAPTSLAATINRTGTDFSEEDRTLLDLLRPHLLQANAKAVAQQHHQAERTLERIELGDVFGVGLGEVNTNGRLLWLTPRAEALIDLFFPEGSGTIATPGTLPEKLAARLLPTMRVRSRFSLEDAARLGKSSWWFAGPDERKLNVRLVVGSTSQRWQLLFEETGNNSQTKVLSSLSNLTEREREVLHWVLGGKTNREISVILAAGLRTIDKHVQNLLTKLQVENRMNLMRLYAEGRITAPARLNRR